VHGIVIYDDESGCGGTTGPRPYAQRWGAIGSNVNMRFGKLIAATVLFALMSGSAFAGSGPTYCRDEADNKLGPNKCATNADCDGARTCSSSGFCQGTSRDAKPAKGPLYCINEAKNKLGPNKCATDMDCDGARTCSPAKFCQGNSGHAAN